MGTGDDQEVTVHFLVRAHGEEAFFLDSLEQHRLFVEPQFADFVEKQHAAVRRPQQAVPGVLGAGEGALDMPEQGRHGAVAAQGGAVDLDKTSLDLMPAALELIDAPGQERLAGTGGADQQHRCPGAQGHPLDLFDGAVERGVAGGDPRLEEGQALQALAGEARGDAVVARQVEVDQGVGAGGVLLRVAAPRREVWISRAGR